jgi:hypothetical protein
MDFWTQNSWIVPLTTISFELWYSPLTDGVCVGDLKLENIIIRKLRVKNKNKIEF